MREEQFIKMADLSYRVRGIILELSTYFEKAIEYYIATYYCGENDKRDILIETLLTNNVGLSAKTSAFLKIIDKEKGPLSKDPKIKNNINQIVKYRNVVAHEVLDTSEAGRKYYLDTGKICLTKLYSNNRTVIDEKFVNDLKKLFEETTTAILSGIQGFSKHPFPEK